MKDHKPNRRRRRAMQRIGDKIVEQIFKQRAIKKANDTEEKTHPGDTEVPRDAND